MLSKRRKEERARNNIPVCGRRKHIPLSVGATEFVPEGDIEGESGNARTHAQLKE